jgi:serine/threonine-protein kinase
MSRVFLATENALRRRVVIKVLSPELAVGVSGRRFEREIQTAASLQQANIVPVLSAGSVGDLPIYVMPFVEGLSLRERLVRDGRPPLAETVNILRDIARALAYAHERGVVHRDIKPENVLLSGDAAVVTDFGIAKAVQTARATTAGESGTGSTMPALTTEGISLGTPAYMAPEQVTADPGIDHRADLYAFGCVAYELLTGAAPFAGRPAHAQLGAHLAGRRLPRLQPGDVAQPGRRPVRHATALHRGTTRDRAAARLAAVAEPRVELPEYDQGDRAALAAQGALAGRRFMDV